MSTARASAATDTSRWAQLVYGVACMVAASNIQYSWTQFVPEIQKAHGWERAAIQTAFSIFVVVQTWCTPFVGALIDRLGPRTLVLFGGVLTGLAWVVNSYATSLTGFYAGAIVGGLGVGSVYATCINNAIKWFPDKRGLAVGLTAAGYGSGTILTVIPISRMIASAGYQSTFFTFGIIQGIVIVLFASFLRAPVAGAIKYAASKSVAQSRRDYTLGEALRTPVFWVMLAMFTGTVTGGLMAVAQLSVIAEDLGVRNVVMNFGFFTMAALPFALMMNTIVNGVSRPVFGWLSDHIGREQVMFLAFGLEAMGILALGWYGSNPWAFVVLSGIVFFAWGEVYSLFSATAGDTFGTKNIGTIYGLLYCAKGIAALLVPFGNLLMESTGTWTTVLYTMAALDSCAALAAILILKPLRRRLAEGDARTAPVQSASSVAQAGFTLIELMVVVAIIGILAAVAIPAFMKNARKAKTAEAVTNVKQIYDEARSGYEEEGIALDLCELLLDGRLSDDVAFKFGADRARCESGDTSTGGGRSDGFTYVYVVSSDRKHFAIHASPAAPGRSADTTISIDETGRLEIKCPPGTTYNERTELCEPEDHFLELKALQALRALNAMSGGVAAAQAQQLVTKESVLMVLEAMDTNGDAALSFDELTGPDLLKLGRRLSTDFGRVKKAGQPSDHRAVEAIVSGYLSTVRADLAPGIADAPVLPVPIAAMSGDVAGLLRLVK